MHRAQLSRLRRREDLRRRRPGHRRTSLPRPVDLERLSQAARRDPAAAAQARRGDRSTSACRRKATTPSPWSTSSRPFRATSCSRRRRPSSFPSCAASSISTSAGACGCSCVATATSVSIPASCTCRATATTPKCANASSASCAQRFGGTHVEIAGADLRLHAGAPAPAGAHAAGRAARSRTSPAIEAEIAAAAATWEDRLQQALIARGVERERRRTRDALCARVSAGLSRRRRAGAGARRHRRPRSARRQSGGAAAQPARAARRTGKPRCTCASCRPGDPIPISDILPMLENFGLRVLAEHPYPLPAGERGACDPGLRARSARSQARRLRRARAAVQGSLPRRVARRNRKRRLQSPAAVRVAERARNRGAARLLPLPAADRHSVQPGVHGTRAGGAGADRRGSWCGCSRPSSRSAMRAREAAAERIRQSILRALDKVASLDEDRILRATSR